MKPRELAAAAPRFAPVTLVVKGIEGYLVGRLALRRWRGRAPLP
ncbi:MAG: hypothetical protein QN162_06335 [Armatimonadota bacterium]|nr:hypothetical protein [Armatimonadota bacterium]